MESSSYFKSACAHCGGHIEAPAEGAGMWIRCPHCGEKTQLGNPSQNIPETNAAPKSASKRAVWIAICLIVIVGLATAFFFLSKKFEQRRQELPQLDTTLKSAPPTPGAPSSPKPRPAPEPDLWNGLKPSAVTIEKPSKGRLIYAVGTIRNDADKQRYGVKVTLDVLDSNGEKIGSAVDQTQFIDAHKEWNFRALVTSSKAKTAKVTSITED